MTDGAPTTNAPLRVMLVNKNAQGGGAERVAMSLLEGLRQRGHRSWLAVANRNVDDASIVAIPPPRPPAVIRIPALAAGSAIGAARRFVPRAKRLQSLLEDVAVSPANALAERKGREGFDYPGSRRILELVPGPVDLVHAHNLHGRYFDLRQLAPLSRRVPVALTLHDEWTYTGHCAYTLGLETWRDGCHHCPDLDVYVAIRRDATNANWEAKQRVYEQARLYVTAPSRWLVERAKASMLAPGVADWRVIPNGVDRAVVRPGDRGEARRLLGLPEGSSILLFTAHRAASSPFKDVATVFAAARRIAAESPGRQVLMLALGDRGASERIGQSELRFVGYERDQERLAAYYRSADLYLHGARADNFPTTILEAFASGLPVVATGVGGIPEAVTSLAGAPGAWTGDSRASDAATGVLVGRGDSAGMAAAASHLLQDDSLRRQLGENAAADAAARFDLGDQLASTIDWYREVIEDWRSATTARAWMPARA